MDQPVDVSAETTAAFIGRALRGPLDTPVLVQSFGEFRRHFGDSWSRSSLGPAAREFFAHGGRKLYVVRVANNARGAMLCLPAGGSALVLRAVDPGSSETLRAAVDYDGIRDETLFNLTVQRVDRTSGLVIDQELFREVSPVAGSASFVADALAASSLVRVERPYPTRRPEPSTGPDSNYRTVYATHAQDGTDGAELTDYDLVGSRVDGTGLFALEQVERFDLLYLPPPARGTDLGPTATLAAELYCRRRHAMLIVDPPTGWRDAAGALSGLLELGYASPNMFCYFPRVRHRDADETALRGAGGAVAGLFSKLDRSAGPWQSLDRQGMGLDRQLSPALDLDDEDVARLTRAGLNVLCRGPAGRARVRGDVTLWRSGESDRHLASLPARRLCLKLIAAIGAATRWAVFATAAGDTAARVRAQVVAGLESLAQSGGLADTRFDVSCRVQPLTDDGTGRGGIAIELVFEPRGAGKPVPLTLHQSIEGLKVTGTAFLPAVNGTA